MSFYFIELKSCILLMFGQLLLWEHHKVFFSSNRFPLGPGADVSSSSSLSFIDVNKHPDISTHTRTAVCARWDKSKAHCLSHVSSSWSSPPTTMLMLVRWGLEKWVVGWARCAGRGCQNLGHVVVNLIKARKGQGRHNNFLHHHRVVENASEREREWVRFYYDESELETVVDILFGLLCSLCFGFLLL